MKNFKTPIEEVLFRSSKIGLLAGGLIRNELSQIQRIELNELLSKKDSVVGLTDNQQKELDKWNKTIKDGKNLTPNQMEKRDEYTARLTRKKELTPNQSDRVQELIEKDNAEPELSKGAKTYIKDIWLWHEKGFKEEISSKQTRKGNQGEEDGINLISAVDNFMYLKNEKRITKGNFTGECDVNTYHKLVEKRIIDDIKLSWNPKTFMSTNMSTLEEWQGIGYLHLYNADIFRLRRCLVDCPPDVYQDEFKKFCWDKQIMDETLPQYKELIEQFDRNFLYEHSGKYTQEERVKTFAFERDEELEAVLLKSIELGLEYYKTITLNMID